MGHKASLGLGIDLGVVWAVVWFRAGLGLFLGWLQLVWSHLLVMLGVVLVMMGVWMPKPPPQKPLSGEPKKHPETNRPGGNARCVRMPIAIASSCKLVDRSARILAAGKER